MSKSHEIDCRQCGEKSTLEDRVMFDGCCWACGAEIDLEDYLARAMDERDQLLAEVERLRMQLAACGVVALANTPESAAKARDMHPDYMSASCQDVMRVVDREMALRAEVEAMRKDAERYRWVKGCDPDEIDIVIENPGDDLDSAIDAAMTAKDGQP